MPDRYRPHRNDNIRTAHLKCAKCKTQIFLSRIESTQDGCELRVFECPHCALTRTVRIGAVQDDGLVSSAQEQS